MAASPEVFRYETAVLVHCARCEWTIRNWRHAVKEGSNDYLDSPPFHAPDLRDVRWHMRLWPNRRYGGGQSAQMDVAVFVDRSELIHSTDMMCSLWSVDPGDRERTFNGSIKRTDYWGLSSRLCAKPDELTRRDLVLECTIRHALKSDASGTNIARTSTFDSGAQQRQARAKIEEEERARALDDFGSMLVDERFADVTIWMGDQAWAAHRAVLSHRSPVFRAMFSHPMSEHEGRSIRVTEDEGIDGQAWSAFLRFLYTGATSDLDTHCISLLKLADKYEVPGLRVLSGLAIAEQLSDESLPHALLLAFLHSAPELRHECLRYLRGAGPSVYSTPEWRQLMVQWPDVLLDALKGAMPSSTN